MAMIYCPKCGAEQTPDSRFCEHCGSMIPTTTQQRSRFLRKDTRKQMPGFLETLFDFSFTEFLTTRIIKLLYGLGLIIAAIGLTIFCLVVWFYAFFGEDLSAFQRIVSLIGSPLAAGILFFLYAMNLRIWMELLIVLFRVAEDTGSIERHSNQIVANIQILSTGLRNSQIETQEINPQGTGALPEDSSS